MKKLFYVLSIAILIFCGTPSFAVDLSLYNYLQDMETTSSEDEIKMAVIFSKPVENIREPQFFEKSIQFTFDKTYLKPAKKTFNLGEELIPNAYIYQYDKNSVRLRLVIGKDDSQLEDRLTYEKKGNQLIVSVSKKSKDLLSSMYEEDLSVPTVDLEEQFNRPIELLPETEYQEDLIPVIYEKTDENKINLDVNEGEKSLVSNGAMPTLFSSSIKVVTGLMVVLSLMMITYYFVKKYLLKDGSSLGMNKQFKVLSTNYFAPKKSINVVEVAGEILVLGVTATNISFLTKIENKEAIEKIKGKKENQLVNWKKSKQTASSFSRHLDAYTSKTEETKKKDSSVKILNRLIEEKINKLKTV